jgi:hypothetical protein
MSGCIDIAAEYSEYEETISWIDTDRGGIPLAPWERDPRFCASRLDYAPDPCCAAHAADPSEEVGALLDRLGAHARKSAGRRRLFGGCHPGYLNGENVNAMPFRWCRLEDFVPPIVMDRHAEIRRRVAVMQAQWAQPQQSVDW